MWWSLHIEASSPDEYCRYGVSIPSGSWVGQISRGLGVAHVNVVVCGVVCSVLGFELCSWNVKS